jgi:hypothetical protein
MMNHINQLIELNLRYVYEHPHQQAELKDLAFFGKLPLADAQVLAEIMVLKNLINLIENQQFNLTEHGQEICKNGGWLAYLKQMRQQQNIPVVSLKKSEQKSASRFGKLIKKLGDALNKD